MDDPNFVVIDDEKPKRKRRTPGAPAVRLMVVAGIGAALLLMTLAVVLFLAVPAPAAQVVVTFSDAPNLTVLPVTPAPLYAVEDLLYTRPGGCCFPGDTPVRVNGSRWNGMMTLYTVVSVNGGVEREVPQSDLYFSPGTPAAPPNNAALWRVGDVLWTLAAAGDIPIYTRVTVVAVGDGRATFTVEDAAGARAEVAAAALSDS